MLVHRLHLWIVLFYDVTAETSYTYLKIRIFFIFGEKADGPGRPGPLAASLMLVR